MLVTIPLELVPEPSQWMAMFHPTKSSLVQVAIEKASKRSQIIEKFFDKKLWKNSSI